MTQYANYDQCLTLRSGVYKLLHSCAASLNSSCQHEHHGITQNLIEHPPFYYNSLANLHGYNMPKQWSITYPRGKATTIGYTNSVDVHDRAKAHRKHIESKEKAVAYFGVHVEA
jgi:hypothetical protein